MKRAPDESRAGVSRTSQDEDTGDPLFRITDLAMETGIPDLATNIDHYLYGHPKESIKGGSKSFLREP